MEGFQYLRLVGEILKECVPLETLLGNPKIADPVQCRKDLQRIKDSLEIAKAETPLEYQEMITLMDHLTKIIADLDQRLRLRRFDTPLVREFQEKIGELREACLEAALADRSHPT